MSGNDARVNFLNLDGWRLGESQALHIIYKNRYRFIQVGVLTRISSLPQKPSPAQTSGLLLACISWSSVPMRAKVQRKNMARRNSAA